MNSKEREIRIPRFLWKLHGMRTSLLELILTYLFGFLLGVYTCYSMDDKALPVWRILLLFLLSVDMGGGVISNFTKSTEDYYLEIKGATSFIWLHLFQGGLLCLVFPESIRAIGVIVVGILIGALTVSKISKRNYQKVIGVFLWLSLFMALDFWDIQPASLHLLLNLFGLKLIVAFAIRWN